MKPILALLLFLSPTFADGPPKTTPVRKATDTELTVVIVPPDGLYDVTVKPKTPAPKGERGIWNITPRVPSKNYISRTSTEWHLKVPAGSYEVAYTTFIADEQVDSFTAFTVGDAPPPIPVVTDPLQSAVNTAFATDSPVDPAAKVAAATKYAAYYRAAATTCYASLATNTDQLWTEIQAVENKQGVDLKALLGCRSIIKSQMAAMYPQGASTNTPCDKAKRDATGDLYARFSVLLEGATK